MSHEHGLTRMCLSNKYDVVDSERFVITDNKLQQGNCLFLIYCFFFKLFIFINYLFGIFKGHSYMQSSRTQDNNRLYCTQKHDI